ncbi:MAG: 4-hydroxy-3-methylbut-2-enyl diphosphate reductase [Spirochaetes bacterium]|nr:4-hydroxy-3-methylbut-2-enyl diphosphate reductase [Spirochaetota bacterium]
MKIIVARSVGFCSGVSRAVTGLLRVLENRGTTYCLGEIIHNPQVVNELKTRGMIVVTRVGDVPEGGRFIIRSHGLPLDIISEAKERSLQIFDFTCPKVKKIHTLVSRLIDDGYFCYIAGNPHHPEVQAILSLTGSNGIVVEQEADAVIKPHGGRGALVVQTTFNPHRFREIAGKLILLSKETLVCNTLCEETLKRQKETAELAEKTDLVVVVGGKKSSNTKTLYQIALEHTEAAHVETPDGLDASLFVGRKRVGVVSGASTPRKTVQEVKERIESIAKSLSRV